MRRLLFILICLSLVSLSQATILKCQAEDAAVINAPGNNWSTIYDEAAGSDVLDVTVQGFTTPPEEAAIRYFKFAIPAGTYTLYIRYTKAEDPAYLNDSFFCSDSSFAQDAVMATRNNTPATGVEDISCEGGSYAWVNIDNNYVQAEDGAAYFKLAPREDGWRCDAFAFVTSDETLTDELLNNTADYNPYAPYDPVYSPQDADGSVGTPVQNGGGFHVDDVILGFTSGPNPAVIDMAVPDPDVVKHNILLQTGAPNDPNLYPVGSIEDLSEVDPDQSFGPLSSLTPAVSLPANTTVQWQVEQVMKDPEGAAYPDGDPNNVMGPVWSFLTSDPAPKIVSITDHTLTDTNGDASFTIAASLLADHYRWYKVVGDVDTEDGESDDEMLTDSGIYSGTTTKTLVITGAASDGSDDARIYAIAYNGDPDVEGAAASEPSAARWFWYPRLVNYYPFESMTVVDSNDVTPDVVSGYDMTMLSNDVGDDVPAMEPNVPSAAGIADNDSSLSFDNPRVVPADPNHGDAQYAEVSEQWAGSYKDVTVSVWVYSKGSSNWNRILDYGNDTDHYMMLCVNVNGDDNDTVRFAVKDGADNEQTVTTGNNALPDNEWTLVTATLSGDIARIFINGEWVVTNDALTNDPVSYGPTTQNWIGRSQWGDGDGYFNGLIDELKIFNYGLTNEEVGQLYLADTLGEYLCDTEGYDIGVYDTDDNCILNLLDFATLAARWMEDDRIHNEP